MIYDRLAQMIPPIRAENIPNEPASAIPGRGDLRISLTQLCNLRCSHCHNEGQKAPWLAAKGMQAVSVESVVELIRFSATYGVHSVKFTGGDPGVYPHLEQLFKAVEGLRGELPGITRWGMATNGTPFMSERKYKMLIDAPLDNICVGIDSVTPGEKSKPNSDVGVAGLQVMEEFVARLAKDWKDRDIKVDTVFTGDSTRTLAVVHAALALGVNVNVIEINGVMGAKHEVRKGFFTIMDTVAVEYGFEARVFQELNEIYLYDGDGRPRVKFYQDHCADLDCGNCRKLHLRVSATPEGWAATPCFLQAQARVIPLMVGAELSASRIEDAIHFNGRGPWWSIGTDYEPSVSNLPVLSRVERAQSANSETIS